MSAKANAIEIGKEFTFTIQELHDRDYFKMKSPGNGVLRLELTKKLTKHRHIYPWWGETTNEEGKRFEIRPGIWDIQVNKDQEVFLAIRSDRHSFNEVFNDEVIHAKVVFEPEESPHEPNDSMTEAEAIEIGKEFTFQLNPLHDRDYFKMKSPGNGVLRLELTKKLTKHRHIYPWWGETKNEDGKRQEIRSGLWDIQANKDQEIFLAIRSDRHSFNEISNDEVIHAKVVFAPEESTSEPNDSMAEAQAIEIGKEFTFQLNPLHDRDYFKMKSPGEGVLKLELVNGLQQHSSIYPWWGETTDGNGARIETRSGIWDISASKDQEVFLAIRSDRHSFNDVSNDEVIRAKVIFSAETQGEPNDTPAQARQTKLNEPFEVTLMPLGDRDCLRFDSPGDGIIIVERLDKKPVHHGLYPVWIEGETARAGVWETRVKSEDSAVLMLRSSQYSFNESSSSESMLLRASFIAEPDAPEPGDERKDAVTVKIGEPFKFALLPRWDRDFFKFVPEKDGYVRLRLDEISQRYSIDYQWFSEEEADESSHSDIFPVRSGETYWLALTPANSGWQDTEILGATIIYSEAPAKPENTVRRWTFPIQRNPASE